MLKLIAGGVALVFTGGIAVLGAQHLSHRPSTQPEMGMLHHACVSAPTDGQSQSHVPEHLATLLSLSAAQVAELDAKAAQACQTMERIHREMLQVLTPEQRDRMTELHRGHGASGVVAWLKKLHGK